MTTRTAIIILIIVGIVVFGGMYFLYQYSQKNDTLGGINNQKKVIYIEKDTPEAAMQNARIGLEGLKQKVIQSTTNVVEPAKKINIREAMQQIKSKTESE
jgi:hypothetical protein